MKLKALIFSILCLLVLPGSSFSQQMYMATSQDGPVLFLDEMGVILKEINKSIVVDFASPASSRKEEYRKYDIQKGDKVLMVNGKKAAKMDDVQKIYEGLKKGEEFKMGMSRDEKMSMVAFKKGDAEKGHGGHAMTTKITGDPKNMLPVMELGFILQLKKDKLVVTNMLPTMPQFLTKANLKEGDQVVKLNGSAVNTIDQFKKGIEKIKTGENIELTFMQNGKEIKASGKKPETKGKVIVK